MRRCTEPNRNRREDVKSGPRRTAVDGGFLVAMAGKPDYQGRVHPIVETDRTGPPA